MLIRFSGYLYWWLNDVDYWAMKLELHNRYRLGYWDARLMVWIKQRPVLRAVLYFVGYHLCYKVVFDVYESMYYKFFRDTDDLVGTELSWLKTVWNGGWNITRVDDVQAYWEDLVLRVGNTDETVDPVFAGPVQATAVCGICCFVAISMLDSLGFRFFEKY